MKAGRPPKADPGSLYAMAHQFYWHFRQLSEGSVRRRFDKKKYAELTREIEILALTNEEDRERHQQIIDEDIRTGRLDPIRKEDRLRDIDEGEAFIRRDSLIRQAAIDSHKEIKVPGEADVIEKLLNPKVTPNEIRELCKHAFMKRVITIGSETREVDVSAWPISSGSPLPMYLAQYAEQYVLALRDPRFPACDVSARPSNKLKQFWFLSRALAGALFGVSTRTAINLVGSLRPEQVFHETRAGKPARTKRQTKRIMNRKY